MTAEERADELADNLFDLDCGVTTEGREFITEAIREAEIAAADEALERAARVAELECDGNDGLSDSAWCAANNIAAEIRSLKSPARKEGT